MTRRTLQTIAVIELILAIVMYFAIAYHYDHDLLIMRIMANTDFQATVLRLSIYIVPGLNIICCLFIAVFSTKGILCLDGLLEILGGLITLYFKGKSSFMNIAGILMIIFGILTILCTLFMRKQSKEATSKSIKNS